MLIGICGLIGSGKGTVADYLVNKQGFTKLSFADKLKDNVAELFDWPRNLLEGDTDESRKWREEPDAFWSGELGKPVTPRWVLQMYGTECMRNGFYDGIWVSLVKKQILENPNLNYVIPDTRFPNEVKVLHELNGEVWCVRRGLLPDWWSDAVAGKEIKHIHASEWSWAMPDNDFDHVVFNDGTIEDLEYKLSYVVKNRLPVD